MAVNLGLALNTELMTTKLLLANIVVEDARKRALANDVSYIVYDLIESAQQQLQEAYGWLLKGEVAEQPDTGKPEAGA